MVAGPLSKLRFPDRFHELSEHYRYRIEGGPQLEYADQIDGAQTRANLHRTKDSHRGIDRFTELRTLVASGCNQDYLDEIGKLRNLVELHLAWPMRAADLTPLAGLDALRVLHIESPSKVEDWSPLNALGQLKVLTVESPRSTRSFEWARPLLGQLEVFGIEGSISTNFTVEDLEPLRGSQVEAFFCASLTVKSKDLTPLHDCRNLKLLSGGVLAPWCEYKALQQAGPDLVCQWFDAGKWLPSWRGGPSEQEREAARR